MTRFKISMILFLSILISSCGDDYGSDSNSNADDSTLSYDLTQANSSAVSGEAVFEKLENGDIQLTVTLNNIEPDANHPAHIHKNAVGATVDDIIVEINNIDGATGESVTVFSEDINGNPIDSSQIPDLNAHINVHQNPDNFDVIAQGNIGSNADSSSDNNDGGGGY